MTADLLRDIAEIRRNMPRNHTVMRICNALEEFIVGSNKQMDNSGSSFDRQKWQREYMRRYRARKRAEGRSQ